MKNLVEIREALLDHLRDGGGKVVLLTGPWGCGKTYLWQNELEPALEEYKPVYLSLFGADSIRSLKTGVMTASLARRARMLKEKEFRKAVKDVGSAARALLFAGLRQGVARLAQTEIAGALDPIDLTEDELIVCLDDLERISENLPIEEVLGYATVLAEAKRCRVLLIANEEHIHEREHAKEAMRRYRERVLAGHVAIAPDIAAVCDRMILAYAPALADALMTHKRIVLEIVERARVENLRTLSRVLRDLAFIIKEVGANRVTQRHVTFLIAIRIEADSGALRDPGFYKSATPTLFALSNGPLDEETATHREFIEKYFSSVLDEFEFCQPLYDLVARGHVDKAVLEEEFAIWAGSALDDLLIEIGDSRTLYYSDDDSRALVERILGALRSSLPIKTAQLIRLFVVSCVVAERAALPRHPAVRAEVVRRLSLNVTEMDETFQDGSRFALSGQEVIWRELMDDYERRIEERREQLAYDGLLDAVRRHDLSGTADAILRKPRALEYAIEHGILDVLDQEMVKDRLFHCRALALVGDELAKNDREIMPSIDAARRVFIERLHMLAVDPQRDYSDRYRMTEIARKYEEWAIPCAMKRG